MDSFAPFRAGENSIFSLDFSVVFFLSYEQKENS